MRERIKKAISLGVPIAVIARESGVARSLFSPWLKGEAEITDRTEKKLETWLNNFKSQASAI